MDLEMQRVLPHGMLACVVDRAVPGEGFKTRSLLLNHFPEESLNSLRNAGGRSGSMLIDRWLSTRGPVMVDLAHDASGWPDGWLQGLRPFGFQNLAWHAMCDIGGHFITTFCFARVHGPLGPHHAHLLRLLVPNLHVALQRALRPTQSRSIRGKDLLSRRHEQMLRWIQMGKTNTEVAMILGMTESNVKYHLRQIFRRLDVTNRAQAVARAAELILS